VKWKHKAEPETKKKRGKGKQSVEEIAESFTDHGIGLKDGNLYCECCSKSLRRNLFGNIYGGSKKNLQRRI
jgi:hypothetical protein